MNNSIKINLVDIPSYGLNEVITTTSEGKPLSRIFDLSWDFSGMEARAVGKSQFVPFSKVEEPHRKTIQSTLAYMIKVFQKKEKKSPSRAQVDNWRKGLASISKIKGDCDWASLSDDKGYTSFKSKIVEFYKGSSPSESALSAILKSLRKLNEYRFCNRIFTLKEFKNLLLLREVQQYIAIPVKMYQKLIAQAIGVIEFYHPYRFDMNKLMIQAHTIRTEEMNNTTGSNKADSINWRARNRVKKIKHGIPNFKIRFDGAELSRILTNCAIITLAFSGVRASELLSFSSNSYKEKRNTSNISIPIVEGETSKGNDGLPIVTTWQTHPIVKDALELAFEITQHLRDEYTQQVNENLRLGLITDDNYKHALREINSAFIAVEPARVTSKYTLGDLSYRVFSLLKKLSITATQDDVDEFNRLNPTREGQLRVNESLPKLSPHDFRRTFAVFFKRYGFGAATSIKFQYKHKNINMSDYYANNARLQAMEDVLLDNDLLELMNEEGIRMGIDIFDEIYNKSDQLSGAGGERIAQNEFQKLKNGHQIYMSRAEIESLVRNGTLSAVKLPTGGYCLNATCSRVCGIGQFAAEIKPCEHQVITDREAKTILRQNKRLIKSFREMNSGDSMMQSILIGIKQKIKHNELIIKKHHLNYEKFNDAVKGTITTREA